MPQHIGNFYLEVGKKRVLLPSSLEIDMKENHLKKNLKIMGTESISYDKTWINTFGKRREVPDKYNEIKILLEIVHCQAVGIKYCQDGRSQSRFLAHNLLI